MAEENTDIKKDGPAKEPSGLSPVPTHTAVPSPDAVAQAFASFEKEHEHHATTPAEPLSRVKVVAPQNNLSTAPAPVAVQPVAVQIPPPPVSVQPIAVPIPPPQVVVPIVPKQTVSVVPPAPVQSTPPQAFHTPTPIVTASFPIAPIASMQKPVVPVQPITSPSNPSTFTQPKVAPVPAPATVEQKVPQTPITGVAPATTPKVKPVIPTMVESLRAQSTSALHPLRTLRSDVEDTVKERKTSMVAVAAAEENRRASKVEVMPLNDPAPPRKKSTVFFVVTALVLLILGGGLLVFAFMPAKKVPIANEPQLPTSTLIFADEVIPFPLAGHNRTSAMSELVKMRENTTLSIGLIREIYPTKIATSTTLSERVEIAPLLQLLAPHANAEFLRTLNAKYILGVHVFDGNQAFIIVTTSSYEQTFVGMVEWEQDMLNDLLPLFDRRPRPRTQTERLSTTTAPSVINTGFADMVIENHDARVLKDSDGNIILLWTFINQNTLAITTNERTLAELVSRIRNAPTLGL